VRCNTKTNSIYTNEFAKIDTHEVTLAT
jgi:hypothetical protein